MKWSGTLIVIIIISMVKNNLIVYNSYLQLKSFKLILVRAFCRGEFNKAFGSGLLWTVWSQSGSSLLFASFTHTCSHSRARIFDCRFRWSYGSWNQTTRNGFVGQDNGIKACSTWSPTSRCIRAHMCHKVHMHTSFLYCNFFPSNYNFRYN